MDKGLEALAEQFRDLNSPGYLVIPSGPNSICVSLRDWFAGMLACGLLSRGNELDKSPDFGEAVYQLVDRMLKARNVNSDSR